MENFSNRLNIAVKTFEGGNASAFAKKAGLKQATLHRYLNGRLPNGENLSKIGKAYNLSLDWLLLGKGAMAGEPDQKQSNNINKKLIIETQDMDEEQLKDILRYTKEKKLLFQIKEELREIKKVG